MIVASILLYLLGGFIFYGFCFGYWQGKWSEYYRENVVVSVIFSLLYPMFILPYLFSKGWKYPWRIK